MPLYKYFPVFNLSSSNEDTAQTTTEHLETANIVQDTTLSTIDILEDVDKVIVISTEDEINENLSDPTHSNPFLPENISLTKVTNQNSSKEETAQQSQQQQQQQQQQQPHDSLNVEGSGDSQNENIEHHRVYSGDGLVELPNISSLLPPTLLADESSFSDADATTEKEEFVTSSDQV